MGVDYKFIPPYRVGRKLGRASLSECKELAKSYGEEIELSFDRFSLTVRPTSDLQDLFEIYKLENARRFGDR